MLAYLRSVAGAEHGFYGATKFSGKARSFSSSRLAKTQAGVLLWVAEWTFTIALTTKEYAFTTLEITNTVAAFNRIQCKREKFDIVVIWDAKTLNTSEICTTFNHPVLAGLVLSDDVIACPTMFGT